jgi:transposase-like protein
MNPEQSPAPDENLRAAMAAVVDMTLPGFFTRRTTRTAGMRLACLGWLVQAPSMAGMTQTALAFHLGMTKAAVSKWVREFSRVTGYNRPGQKPRAARAHYAAAAQRGWAARRQNDLQAHAAAAAVRDCPRIRGWLNCLPKHNRRRALVLIGTLPTEPAMHRVLLQSALLGWRGMVDLRRRVERLHREVIETGPAPAGTQPPVMATTEKNAPKVVKKNHRKCLIGRDLQ